MRVYVSLDGLHESLSRKTLITSTLVYTYTFNSRPSHQHDFCELYYNYEVDVLAS